MIGYSEGPTFLDFYFTSEERFSHDRAQYLMYIIGTFTSTSCVKF